MADDVMSIDAQTYPVSRIDLVEVRVAIDEKLREFFAGKATWANGSELADVVDALRDYLLGGGKRLRPLLAYCGWRAAGGKAGHDPALRAAASLELFHAFALIHDDIIDVAESRRGRPSLHRTLARRHGDRGDAASVERLGTSSAILVGDLAMVWSDELLHASGMSMRQLAAARPLLDAMRTELMYGQYLDLMGTGAAPRDAGAALTIARYKSGKYTIERPLHIGARLAGADQRLLDACSAFGLPIGEAFQLRDDLLGIFGDPVVTGKSRLDDLRDGKGTVLLALALRRADESGRATLTRLVGDPELDEEGAARVRRVFVDSGAVGVVEEMIQERLRQGLAVLDSAPFQPEAAAALREMAHAATVRAA
ncbi:polyprenyl synthetase family protein [Micromonospora sp. NPDC049559]|uniref:polyprenyl synthetase family protein n=1 Tax=Micromonospora sp. NPDC049559 TaxID=3155923 RepID=UPI00344145AB